MPDTIPIMVAAVLYLTRIREFFVKRDTVKGEIREKTTFLLLFAGGTLVTVFAMIEHIAMNKPASALHVIAGAAITIGAFAYRNWAIRTLGKFWSVHVEIRDNHELIESGPFRRTRHPVYSAAILEAIGIVLILQAYLSSLIILLVIFPAILLRIRIEERGLIAKFGDRYRDYISRTGCIVPRLY